MNNEIDFYTVLQSVKKSFLEELQKYPSKSYKKEILIDNNKCSPTSHNQFRDSLSAVAPLSPIFYF